MVPEPVRKELALQELLGRLRGLAEARGHRLQRFEVVSVPGLDTARSKCLLCGFWLRLNREDDSLEFMGPALKKDCSLRL